MQKIELCQSNELTQLRQLATKTFVATYGIHNTPEVMTAYLAEAFSDEQLRSEINNPASEFYILKVDGTWVGYIKVNEGKAQTEARTDNALELERIYVDRDFQGNGYGKLLLNKAIEVASLKQKDRVWLGVWQKNPNAIQFYESQGYVKNGTHVFIIGGEEQMDWIMEKEISIEGLILETDRLYLQAFTLEHTAFTLALLNSPGWIQYIGDKGIRTEEATRKYLLNGPMAAFTKHGYGFSVITLKENDQPIGGCGLINRDGLDYADIGFALLPEYAGQGYAYEIAAATIAYARNELKLTKVLGITLPANKRSIQLLEKIGLQFEKMIHLPGDDEELMLFSVDLE